jgi:aspartate aminotransferase-like enzyme
MKLYPIPMVPGPVRVFPEVLEKYQFDYASGDLEHDYLELYNSTETSLQEIFSTSNKVVIQTGEGMLALWGALKSCLVPGDRVLSIATGVFGYGIAAMAKSIGASVKTIGLPYNETIHNWVEIEEAIASFDPKMITVVHCETPSGTLNPMQPLGELKSKYSIPLLYADVVASLGGAPVLTDECSIDLALGGTQKCLSAPPNMAFVTVSEKAWEVIDQVNYVGYDAIKPFRTAQENFYFPYTPYWHGMEVLHMATQVMLNEGLSSSYRRHEMVAAYCRDRLARMGLDLFPANHAIPSPTVTAVQVPAGVDWKELDERFRKHGLVVGGSYGPLEGKVFRLGHMGSQGTMELVTEALDVIEKSI